mgnify:CR=1 FL=1
MFSFPLHFRSNKIFVSLVFFPFWLAEQAELFLFSFRKNLISAEFLAHLRFSYSEKSPPVTFAKRLFCKNGFTKGKNEHTTTAVQEHFLFAWLYYSTNFYFVNRFLKKILRFRRRNFKEPKKTA